MYAPVQGRFLSRDPLLDTGIVVLYDHPFAYASNNPVNRVDPSGLVDWTMPGHGVPANPYRPPEVIRQQAIEYFMAWYNREKRDLSWNNKLPPCPCKVTKVTVTRCYANWGAPGFGYRYTEEVFVLQDQDKGAWEAPGNPNIFGNFHPGAASCIRSKPVPGTRSGEQCCYDKDGALITNGAGAGSADKGAPSNGLWDNLNGPEGHQIVDVDPWKWAQWLDGGTYGPFTKLYQEVRPTNNKNNCPTNKKP